MVTSVKVNWEHVSYEEFYGKRCVYALILAGKPVFFGYAYHSEVASLLEDSIDNKTLIDAQGVAPWIGHVSESNMRVTKQLIEDIRNLLIYVYEPAWNGKNYLT